MDALAEGTAPKDEIIARLNEEKQRKTVRATELTKLSKLASIGSLLCSLAWVRDYRRALIKAAVGKVGRGRKGNLLARPPIHEVPFEAQQRSIFQRTGGVTGLSQGTANRVIQDASRPLKRLSPVTIVLLLHVLKDSSQLIAAFAKRLGLFATQLDPIHRRPGLGYLEGPAGSQAQRRKCVVAWFPGLPLFEVSIRIVQQRQYGIGFQFDENLLFWVGASALHTASSGRAHYGPEVDALLDPSAATPEPTRQGACRKGWASSSVRVILLNEKYVGSRWEQLPG